MLQVINPIKNALQQGWKKLPKKRIASFVGMFIFCAMATYASSKGAGGFTKATTEISSYQTPVANLMKAIAAVIVLTIMMTIGGCVAFIAMSEALPMFFK